MTPFVSVLMPVYNDSRYLKEAIDSILNQTFQDFELVIINDGSTDDSGTLIASYSDMRIRVLNNNQNIGVASSLNRGIAATKSRYIARQDADDVSLPTRLELQVKYLEARPDVGVIGSQAHFIDEEGFICGDLDKHCDEVDIKWRLLFNNPLTHSSVMIRRAVLKEVGFYSIDPSCRYIEDYDLWCRIADVARIVNLKERLIRWRLNPGSVSSRARSDQAWQADCLARKRVSSILRIPSVDPETWNSVKLFCFQGSCMPVDLKASQVRLGISFLEELHSKFCTSSGLDGGLCRDHRAAVYWIWGKHAIALSYRGNGRRDARCRLALFTCGARLLLKLVAASLLSAGFPPESRVGAECESAAPFWKA